MTHSEYINDMIETIIEMARGDYSAQIKLSSRNDELDSLAMGINMMIDDIRENVEKEKRKTVELDGTYQELKKTQNASLNIMEDLEMQKKDLNALNEQLQKEITERIRVEQQIKMALEEKELLLKEIHHRVKNNLQVIYSLLNLQAKYITDKEDKEIFKQAQNRVKTMALIHEKLYKSKDLMYVDFSDYIKHFTSHLFRSYSVSEGKIKLKINTDNVFLDLDRAIPCGLLINELVSNAIKHAFPNNKREEISISFCAKNKKYILRIADNGKGFPENLDFRNTKSLGLQLVCALTEQLNGSVELDRRSGTTFKITFGE